jgi:hypothetical protein
MFYTNVVESTVLIVPDMKPAVAKTRLLMINFLGLCPDMLPNEHSALSCPSYPFVKPLASMKSHNITNSSKDSSAMTPPRRF